MLIDGSTSLERTAHADQWHAPHWSGRRMPVDGSTARGLIAPGFMQRDTGIVQKQPM